MLKAIKADSICGTTRPAWFRIFVHLT